MEDIAYFKFEDLIVYKKSMAFTTQMYRLTKNFSKEEMFGLTSQLRRAAVSVAVNIAEGAARTKKDFKRFLDISQGSVYECVALLQIAGEQNYIDASSSMRFKSNLAELSKMLSGLKRSLQVKPKN